MDNVLENIVQEEAAVDAQLDNESCKTVVQESSAAPEKESCAEEKAATPFEIFRSRKKEKRSAAKRMCSIVKAVLIFLLAAVMLGFSFLPIVSFDSTYGNYEVSVPITLIDRIDFVRLSFFKYSSTAESIYYHEADALKKELQENASLDGITDGSQLLQTYGDDIAKISLLLVKAKLMTADVKASLPEYICVICAVLYLAFVASFFVFAIINLIRVLCKKEWKGLQWWVDAHLGASPAAIVGIVCILGVCDCMGLEMLSMSIFSIAALIFAVATVLYSIVVRMVLDKAKNGRVFCMRGIVALLAVALMIFCVTPVFNAVISDVEIGMSAASFNKYSAITDNDAKEMDGNEYASLEKLNNVRELRESLDSLSKVGKKSVVGVTVSAELTATMMLYRYGVDGNVHFALVPVIASITVLLAALVLSHCLKYMISGNECKIAYLIYRIILFAFAAAFLTLSIIFVVAINGVASVYIAKDYSATMGIASIAVTSLALVILACPAFKNKTAEPQDEDSELYELIKCFVCVGCAEKEATSNSVEMVASEIKALKELYDIGAITDDEFTAKKSQLLGI